MSHRFEVKKKWLKLLWKKERKNKKETNNFLSSGKYKNELKLNKNVEKSFEKSQLNLTIFTKTSQKHYTTAHHTSTNFQLIDVLNLKPLSNKTCDSYLPKVEMFQLKVFILIY